MKVNTTTPVVSIGIDAAVVAAHQIAIRGEVREDFKALPTLAGLAKLTERLEPYAGSLVVAEPTAGTWLPLAHAVTAAGCEIGFVANRDSARLRKAITGASKTDLIDATCWHTAPKCSESARPRCRNRARSLCAERSDAAMSAPLTLTVSSAGSGRSRRGRFRTCGVLPEATPLPSPCWPAGPTSRA